MGTFINAYCGKCGFRQEGMMYGTGFSNREPKIPALKKDTGELVVVEKTVDPNLLFYHQEEMFKGKISGDGIQCFDIHLSHEHNLCPGCGKFTMEFTEVGEWD